MGRSSGCDPGVRIGEQVAEPVGLLSASGWHVPGRLLRLVEDDLEDGAVGGSGAPAGVVEQDQTVAEQSSQVPFVQPGGPGGGRSDRGTVDARLGSWDRHPGVASGRKTRSTLAVRRAAGGAVAISGGSANFCRAPRRRVE